PGRAARRRGPARRPRSSTQPELRDQRPVALEVGALEVAQHAAALADEHQQAAARVVVLAVLFEVAGELVDPLGEQGDLDLGGAGVALAAAVLADQLALLFLGQAHVDLKKAAPFPGGGPLQASTGAGSASLRKKT